ncbi:hypothetical protein C7271_07830 [filamentous cyanobacterium CCP5]|nr:hypothetical protein C7271_07830 [filamentous cyanobacterium CCP5]
MQEQKATKVTLYLPPDLHRQLKVKSALDGKAMSAIAERAIDFYLSHSEVVDEGEGLYGQTHQVHDCPACSTSLVIKDGELAPVGESVAVDASGELMVGVSNPSAEDRQPDEGELVACS